MRACLLLGLLAGAAASPPGSPAVVVDVFRSGEGGFPCWRVPSLVLAESSGVLFAFAEARNYSGDNCYPKTADGLACYHHSASPSCHGPRSLALKTSRNGGATWSAMSIVDWNGCNPASVYDSRSGKVIVHYPSCVHAEYPSGHPIIGGSATKQLICDGVTGQCGTPIPLRTQHGPISVSAGPGLGVQLATGRLVFAGHAGQMILTWWSDDSAASWTLSNRTFGSNNKSASVLDGPFYCDKPHGCLDEPFVVQLPGSTASSETTSRKAAAGPPQQPQGGLLLQLNMRNDSQQCNHSCADVPRLLIANTHPRTVADSVRAPSASYLYTLTTF
jgi:hypothetical protein